MILYHSSRYPCILSSLPQLKCMFGMRWECILTWTWIRCVGKVTSKAAFFFKYTYRIPNWRWEAWGRCEWNASRFRLEIWNLTYLYLGRRFPCGKGVAASPDGSCKVELQLADALTTSGMMEDKLQKLATLTDQSAVGFFTFRLALTQSKHKMHKLHKL